MTVLVVALTAAVALLAVLVVGLLKSHAEILRQLHALGSGREDTAPGALASGAPAPGEPARPADAPFDVRPDVLAPAGVTGTAAHDLVGLTPAEDSALVSVVGAGHDTLLAFLSSGCSTCQDFWDAFAGAGAGDLGLPPATRLVAVTKGPDRESQTTVARLGAGPVPVVMSTEAWDAYAVPGSPYFVLVDGAAGRVAGEGSASSWEQVVRLCRDASADRAASLRRHAGAHDHADRGGDGPHREARADRELAAAGILPGHPSLYADDDESVPTTVPAQG